MVPLDQEQIAEEKVFAKYKLLEDDSILTHITPECGNMEFYDGQGPKGCDNLVNEIFKYLSENNVALGINFAHRTSRFGEVYVASKKKPTLESVNVKGLVRLVVSQVE